MSIDDIASVVITSATRTPTRPGFGTPLFAVYHTKYVDRVRSYTKLSSLVSDGFAVDHPAYLMAQAAFSQNPRPSRVKIGRRALPTTQVMTITITDATEGNHVKFKIRPPGGVAPVQIDYTILAAATATTVATAVELLIEAVADITSSSTGAVITATTTAGKLADYYDFESPAGGMTIRDDSTDPGIATDLAAIVEVDNDWYGLSLDSCSEAEVKAAAAWVESNGKLFIAHSADHDIASSSTTDLASDLKASAYGRTAVAYNSKSTLSYAGCAWLGAVLPLTPGSETWAYKELRGQTVDVLTDTKEGQVYGKNANTYLEVAGLKVTQKGKVAGGEFIDVVRFLDWVRVTMQLDIFALIANSRKVPFTDLGADKLRNVVQGVLTRGVKVGGFTGDPAPEVFVPKVADVPVADRAARNFPDIEWTATLAGAIHTVTVSGLVSV
jgi:hypothetical protein